MWSPLMHPMAASVSQQPAFVWNAISAQHVTLLPRCAATGVEPRTARFGFIATAHGVVGSCAVALWPSATPSPTRAPSARCAAFFRGAAGLRWRCTHASTNAARSTLGNTPSDITDPFSRRRRLHEPASSCFGSCTG